MMTIVFGTVLPWLLIAIGTWLGISSCARMAASCCGWRRSRSSIGPGRRRQSSGRPAVCRSARSHRTLSFPISRGCAASFPNFVNRTCCSSSSTRNAGSARRWPPTWPPCRPKEATSGPYPIVVTTGDAEENRKLVEHYGIRCLVLLQEQMEVAAKYRAQGTPMGYRIDGAGRIASELAVGAEPLLRLATTLAPDQIEPDAAANGSAPHGAKTIPRWPAVA